MEEKATGKVSFRFEWGGQCADCPLKAQCVSPVQTHRTLCVGRLHTVLQTRRREQKTEPFMRRMHQRNAIEGTFSENVRAHGLRQARFRGLRPNEEVKPEQSSESAPMEVIQSAKWTEKM